LDAVGGADVQQLLVQAFQQRMPAGTDEVEVIGNLLRHDLMIGHTQTECHPLVPKTVWVGVA